MKKVFWNFVSLFGTLGAGLAFVALAFLFGLRFGLVLFANLALITFVSNTYKVFFFKARPDNPKGHRPPNPITYATAWKLIDPRVAWAYFKFVDAGSFPSIHSARSFNQALLFAFAFATLTPWVFPAFLIGALLVGYSRVVKRRHWPADVFGGAILGLACALCSYLAFFGWWAPTFS